ncbi:MAG: hypothetical protein CVU34_12220 [Betaproteobacteria bacterium HGW-Betaproteobacteria-7]|nr:MAG: hypothetical protein CVU34_12220 [Betaproteobacteria bacterium HGW-Betaproteobacteria-7]
MLRLLAWLAGTLLLLVLAAGGLLIATLEDQPLVSRPATITAQSIAQARLLLLTNDPRRLQPGDARRAVIPAGLLDEAVNYAATRFLRGRAALKLNGERQAELLLSLQPSWLAGIGHINVAATLHDADGLPAITALRLGQQSLPAAFAEPLLGGLLTLAGYGREWQQLRDAIRQTRFDPRRQRLIVSYVWQPALLEQARALAASPADKALIEAAHANLTGLLADRAPDSRVALSEVLAPMLTTDRTTGGQRAALLVLAAFLAERNLTALFPEAADWPRPPPVKLTLGGRYDSAQHFVISAALAAWAGEPLADAIGTYKELADARHGYGFSFADLASDRAGKAFGELLVGRSPRLETLLASKFSDADLLPALDGLPEYLRQREFRQRFGGPGQPAYEEQIVEIDRRLMAMPLYRRNGD